MFGQVCGGGRLAAGGLLLMLLCGCDLSGGAHAPTDPKIAKAEAAFECAGPSDTSALVRHEMPSLGAGEGYFDVPPGFTVFGFPVKELHSNGAVLWAKLPQEEFTVMAAIRKRMPNGELRQQVANSSGYFDLLPAPGFPYGSPGMAVRPLEIESEGHDSAVRCG